MFNTISIFKICMLFILFFFKNIRVQKTYCDNNLFLNYFKSNSSEKSFKIILWTKCFGLKWPSDGLHNCRYNNCIFTSERKSIESFDALVFHWRDINRFDLPKQMKHLNQKWILFNMEPPQLTYDKFHLPFNMRLFKDIDWFMSYRTDSDIYIPYGRLQKCDNNWKQNYKFEDKSKQIAWIVSNCKTQSQREKLVNQLKKYINVDVYGDCGRLKCALSNLSCYQMIEKNYKFYLSFENALCKDYVTEKLFRTLQYNIIPVVFGSANYSSLLPNNSYIDVFKFTSIRQLSDHMIEVINDKNLYNSYFEWKNKFCIKVDNYLCKICEHLNENWDQLSDRKKFEDLTKWWVNGANCKSYEIKN